MKNCVVKRCYSYETKVTTEKRRENKYFRLHIIDWKLMCLNTQNWKLNIFMWQKINNKFKYWKWVKMPKYVYYKLFNFMKLRSGFLENNKSFERNYTQ